MDLARLLLRMVQLLLYLRLTVLSGTTMMKLKIIRSDFDNKNPNWFIKFCSFALSFIIGKRIELSKSHLVSFALWEKRWKICRSNSKVVFAWNHWSENELRIFVNLIQLDVSSHFLVNGTWFLFLLKTSSIFNRNLHLKCVVTRYVFRKHLRIEYHSTKKHLFDRLMCVQHSSSRFLVKLELTNLCELFSLKWRKANKNPSDL